MQRVPHGRGEVVDFCKRFLQFNTQDAILLSVKDHVQAASACIFYRILYLAFVLELETWYRPAGINEEKRGARVFLEELYRKENDEFRIIAHSIRIHRRWHCCSLN